jgi:hypothetical protein
VVNPNQPSHITWYYGDYGNYTLLNHQHGATYDANGNIWVADSDNYRVVAINYTTRVAYWSYDDALGWVRGSTPLSDGNVLIAATDEVIEVNPAQQVVWSYTAGIMDAYVAWRLPNGNTVISNNFGTSILTVSPSGTLVSSIGFPFGLLIPAAVALPILSLPLLSAIYAPSKVSVHLRNRITRRLLLYEICGVSLIVIITTFLAWVLSATEYLPFLPNSWR